MFKSTIVIGAVFLSDSAYSFHIPGLIPKTYRAGDRVPIQISQFSHNFGSKRIEANEFGQPQYVDLDSFAFGVPQMFEQIFPMCGLRHAEKSSLLGGYFGDSKLLDTPMYTRIDSKQGIVNDADTSNMCHIVCKDLTWTTEQVVKLNHMIEQNYSYKMYLDDLPSATDLEGSSLDY